MGGGASVAGGRFVGAAGAFQLAAEGLQGVLLGGKVGGHLRFERRAGGFDVSKRFFKVAWVGAQFKREAVKFLQDGFKVGWGQAVARGERFAHLLQSFGFGLGGGAYRSPFGEYRILGVGQPPERHNAHNQHRRQRRRARGKAGRQKAAGVAGEAFGMVGGVGNLARRQGRAFVRRVRQQVERCGEAFFEMGFGIRPQRHVSQRNGA